MQNNSNLNETNSAIIIIIIIIIIVIIIIITIFFKIFSHYINLILLKTIKSHNFRMKIKQLVIFTILNYISIRKYLHNLKKN